MTGVLLLAMAALWGWLRPAADAAPTRHRIVLWDRAYPDFLIPSLARVETRLAISPDGSLIAFTDSAGEDTRLLLKRRNEVHPVAIAGTDGAAGPFFSPDGEWIGYFTHGGRVRKVPVAGGGSVDLATSGNETYVIGTWLDDGRIIFVNGAGGLSSVPGDGGPTTQIRTPDAAHRDDPSTLWPLPGSRGLLYTGCPGNCASGSGAYVYDLERDTARLLVAGAAGVWYSPTGHLLYASREGGLYAAPFDLDDMTVTGGAVPVADGVAPAGFALSNSGTALYTVGTEDVRGSRLVWVSRDGSEEPFASDWTDGFEYPALSPDGTSLAVSVRDASTQLWIRRADGSRVRVARGELGTWRPSWSADGRSVAFTTTSAATSAIAANDAYVSPADGSTPPALLADLPVGIWEIEYSRDGEWIVVRADEQAGFSVFRARRLRGDTALALIYSDSSFSTQVALSPDSRWLAFASDRSGRSEVYVASFPGMQVMHPVSQGGGTEPRWSHSGRELFFKSRGQLMSLSVAAGAGFAPGSARALFAVGAYAGANNRPQYDVAPDDRRFLMIRRPDRPRQEVVMVENFFADIEARIGR